MTPRSLPFSLRCFARSYYTPPSTACAAHSEAQKWRVRGGPDRGGGQRRALTHHEFEACTHKGVPWGSYTRLPKYETSRRGGGEEGLADTICQLANGVLRNAVCKYEGRVGELGNWTFIFFVATSANLTSKKLKQCDLKKCLKKLAPVTSATLEFGPPLFSREPSHHHARGEAVMLTYSAVLPPFPPHPHRTCLLAWVGGKATGISGLFFSPTPLVSFLKIGGFLGGRGTFYFWYALAA